MEAYKTTCPDCGHVRFWTGYKTGLGKTQEQLAQMHKEETTCEKCGSTNAQTELDHESEAGRIQDEVTSSFLGAIIKALSE
ncbi:hypothetical protein A2303_00190 [Candidatus Falkowbacteria bacterium RIFOXYB2_FULL_47_14]|uniref:Uncharacterized protein n=1 Tax=Candidatus Falkowbacteria bacterium RIFOXYA2_FULL_47_19 TaxID=1797994 RepID=A0A1F5SPH9_9BACT|nr:MAG: hypothetical protein A2227_01470 [Candidatus Falkowbacteria bacterium RIFOXYA2_FULL_47_19]OGF36801.1 MAG: hypothetical protein A2468_03290 [Candidatus Falkowbacteria bacterium RIFOXYC2_FULL_46_15]OGF44074.1 MAG: hypothetical protein A2303_00190 [Candidatus Falkowbacteria bacterium RIFOXYB2_FULL_47_14]